MWVTWRKDSGSLCLISLLCPHVPFSFADFVLYPFAVINHLTSTTICWVLWVLANHRNWWWSWEALTIHWQILSAFLSKYIMNMIISHFLHCFCLVNSIMICLLVDTLYQSPNFHSLFLEHIKLIKIENMTIPPLLKPSSDQTSHSKKKQSIYMTSVVWLLVPLACSPSAPPLFPSLQPTCLPALPHMHITAFTVPLTWNALPRWVFVVQSFIPFWLLEINIWS